MEFTRRVRSQNTCLVITIPAEIVQCYHIKVGDFLTLDLKRNRRDGKVE